MSVRKDEPYHTKRKRLSILFFSREKSRAHVHVVCSDGETKYWLKPEIELAKNHGLSHTRLKEIEGIIEVHYEEFAGAWEERLR